MARRRKLPDEYDDLALRLKQRLSEGDGAEVTVTQLASEFELDEATIVLVLDEYDASGPEPVRIGPGEGFGWTSEPIE